MVEPEKPLKVPEVEKFYKLPDSWAVVEFRINTGFTASCFFGTLLVAFAQIKDFYISIRCSATIVSTWLDRFGLMSVIWNLSRLIWFAPKYLRLFTETYLQIRYQKYLDTFCYPYRSLNLTRLRKKFNFFNRFYYYSDSNIKVKSCEEPPSPQPCPFFLQKQVNSYFSS